MTKSRDNHNRWRNKTIAFRVSPEEDAQINRMVSMSGLTKQEYLTGNMLRHQLIIHGSSRIYKGLRAEMKAIAEELGRLGNASEIDDELLTVIKTALEIYEKMNVTDEEMLSSVSMKGNRKNGKAR